MCATESRMLHQQISLDTEQRERLRVLSERTRVPQSVFIREGIDAILALEETDGIDSRVDPQ